MDSVVSRHGLPARTAAPPARSPVSSRCSCPVRGPARRGSPGWMSSAVSWSARAPRRASLRGPRRHACTHHAWGRGWGHSLSQSPLMNAELTRLSRPTTSSCSMASTTWSAITVRRAPRAPSLIPEVRPRPQRKEV